jgi:hypothetical protein
MTMGKKSAWENPCPSVTVPTTNIARIILRSNPSLPDEVGLILGELVLRYGDRISPYSVR